MSKVMQIVNEIYTMDSEGLNRVISAVKDRRNQLHTQQAQSLSRGDAVEFIHKGLPVGGTVKKVNIKYVIVETAMGTWRVPVAHLKRKVAA